MSTASISHSRSLRPSARLLTQRFQPRQHAAIGALAHIAERLHDRQPQLRLRRVAAHPFQQRMRLGQGCLAALGLFQRNQHPRLRQRGPELRIGVAIAAGTLERGLGGLQGGPGVVDRGGLDALPRLRLRPQRRAEQHCSHPDHAPPAWRRTAHRHLTATMSHTAWLPCTASAARPVSGLLVAAALELSHGWLAVESGDVGVRMTPLRCKHAVMMTGEHGRSCDRHAMPQER